MRRNKNDRNVFDQAFLQQVNSITQELESVEGIEKVTRVK